MNATAPTIRIAYMTGEYPRATGTFIQPRLGRRASICLFSGPARSLGPAGCGLLASAGASAP
jgi:hypothetical protein